MSQTILLKIEVQLGFEAYNHLILQTKCTEQLIVNKIVKLFTDEVHWVSSI